MWQICRSEYIYKSRWLTVRKDAVRTDKGIDIDDFYVLEYPTWVNVIAITQEGKFVIEQQYRHGIQQQVFELCAGVCETNEKPIDAAKRELLEETGFGGGTWSLMGRYAPNPNSMSNWCYSFLAEGVTKIQEPHQEPTENILVHQVSKEELLSMMKSGKIVEGIMLTPLWHYYYEQKTSDK
jgi:8-oxo-dGTP pyrophosphatase MutT (NUDIX family)